MVRVCSIDDAPTCPVGYDLVIVGSSIDQGHHLRTVLRWVKSNAEQLNRLPSAFFQINMSSAGAVDGESGADKYLQEALGQTGWQPGQVGVFAGALLYTPYGLVKRSKVRSIARTADSGSALGGCTYTDYAAIWEFARDAEALLRDASHRAA